MFFRCMILLLLSPLTLANLSVINNDSPSPAEGFYDTTPVSPVGGNTGTTLGQQRLNVFNKAADILNTIFDIQQPVRIRANFDPLTCSGNSAVLGQAGAVFLRYVNEGGEFLGYHEGLYNQKFNTDADPAVHEINARFNSTIDTGSCLRGNVWYYGYDDQGPANTTSLLPVVLHEIMHGMGFSTSMESNGHSGHTIDGRQVFDVYSRFLKHQSSNTLLKDLSQSQRASALVSNGNLVWDGPAVTAQAGNYSSGVNNGKVRIYAPSNYTPGSSVSHFDSALSPNEIMEPSYTEFLDDPGLATQLLVDLGWTLANQVNNRTPIFSAIANQTFREDNTRTINLMASDPDNDALTFSVSSAISELSTQINGSTLTITPAADYAGNSTMTVRVSDGQLHTERSFNISVTAVNDAPVFAPLDPVELTNTETRQLQLSATDVDNDNNQLTFRALNVDTNLLTAAITGNRLTITPVVNASGSTSLTLEVSDGSLTSRQTVAVTIRPAPSGNQAPILATINTQTMLTNSQLQLSLSATDADNDALIYTATSSHSGLTATISGSQLTLSATDTQPGNYVVAITVSDGQASDNQSFAVILLPSFTLSSGDQNLPSGSTVAVDLNDVTLRITGGDNRLTTTVFFNGQDQSSLLTQTSQGYQLQMPKQGAFAGRYRINVQDQSGFNAHYFIERPLRIRSNLTPLLDVADNQEIWVEGAPAGSLIELITNNSAIVLSGNSNQRTAIDNPVQFNRAAYPISISANADTTAYQLTATATNLPDGSLSANFERSRQVTFTVTNSNDEAVAGARITASDTRLSQWNLATAATSNDQGQASLTLTQQPQTVSVQADGYSAQTQQLDGSQQSLAVTLNEPQIPFTLTGLIFSQGVNFAQERPRATLVMTDGSQLPLSVTLNSSQSTASFEWRGDLNQYSPEKVTISHSQATDINVSISTDRSSDSVTALLIAIPLPTQDEPIVLGGGSSGAGVIPLMWLLLLSAGFIKLRKKILTQV